MAIIFVVAQIVEISRRTALVLPRLLRILLQLKALCRILHLSENFFVPTASFVSLLVELIKDEESMDIGCVKQTYVDARATIAARLGVKGEFIRVPQLAKALGISSTSIHAQMRRGNFPISHRRVGNVILVKLDDYVQWFENGLGGISECEIQSEIAICERQSDERFTQSEFIRVKQVSIRETKAAVKERIHQEVLSDMRYKGFNV